MTRVEIENGKTCPSASGTTHGYKVQARAALHDPVLIGGRMFDARWRTVENYSRNDGRGIPMSSSDREIRRAGLLTLTEAQALRWYFIAAAEAQDWVNALGLETRLVEYKVEYKWSATPVAYLGAADRRGDMPDDMSHEVGTVSDPDKDA